jgi:ABC-2 type transport system permease protein
MRKVVQLAWNDIRTEFSEPITLVFFLVLPLLFTTVVGMTLRGNPPAPGSDTRIPVLVVDRDGGTVARELVAALEASDVARPVVQPAAEAEQAFKEEGVPALLTLPAGLSAAALSGQPVSLELKIAPGNSQAIAAQQAVAAATSRVSGAVAAALVSVQEREASGRFESDAARQAYLEQGLVLARQALEQPPARIERTEAATVTAATAEGFEQSSPGQMVTWVLITLIGAAEVFVGERLGGTLRRLFVTPTGKASILSGKIGGRLIMGIVQMVLLIGFGALVFHVDWGRSPLALAVIVLAFALAAVSLGVLLGTFARTRSQAAGLTILFSMLMAALGGAWWPLEVTPQVYQKVVQVLPTTWAMKGFTDVIVRGQGLSGVLPEAAILLGFALVFFILGVWRFRYE